MLSFAAVNNFFYFYFIYKDVTTYPRMKRELSNMQEQAKELAAQTESMVFKIQDEQKTDL